ncbi:hypothetical protein PVAND_013537 [Polypedilum vanderplanki]|uniref:Uncharacterized protein n=1 Tax=Polypedilum vanderplanki TaxID=319348 RepID=A0A9J6CRP9_POLVA|nr:hypothetical protein PVAND_013537 [Polypedilum vanderplanki]
MEQDLNNLEAILARHIKKEALQPEKKDTSKIDKDTQTDVPANFNFEISEEEFLNLTTKQQDFLVEFMEVFNIKDSQKTEDILARLETRKKWSGLKKYSSHGFTYGPHFG